MLTRSQKAQQIEEGEKLLAQSKSLVFVDFGGKSVGDLQSLRRSIAAAGATLKIIKKRLLRIIFARKNIAMNPEDFSLQAGTIFGEGDIATIAPSVYKSGLTILGGYDVLKQSVLDAQAVKFIGTLPPREALLGQLAGMLAAPITMFMRVLQEKGKKGSNNKLTTND